MQDAKSPLEESADANLLADGQRYKTVFDEEIRALLPTCIQESGTDLSNSKILLRIGRDDMVDQVITAGDSRLAPCLLRKISEQGGTKRGVFPSPPSPDYWIRVNLNLADSAESATQVDLTPSKLGS